MPQNYNACSPAATPPTQFVNNTPGTLGYAIGFPYIAATDIVVFTGDTGNWTLRNQGTGANEYAVNPQTGLGTDQVVFVGGTPGANILITRRSDLCEAARVFQAGASIRAQDLNTDMNQLRFLIQELYSWLEMFVGNEGDELVPGENPGLGDLGDVDTTGAVNRSYIAFDGTDWEDARVWRSNEVMGINDTDIATTAANDARYLASGGGNLIGGPGIRRDAAGGNVTLSVDLHGTTPGLELDPAGNTGQLRVLGNSVDLVGTNVQIVNGPSTVQVTAGGGIDITRNSASEFTIATTTGAGGATFRGTVDVDNNNTLPATTGQQNPNAVAVGDAFTVEQDVASASVTADWDTVIDGWTTTDAQINSGDVIICTTAAAAGSPTNARYNLIRTGGANTLQTVTTAGNGTTNDIQMSDGAGIIFQNDAQTRTVELNADDCTQTYNITLPPTIPGAGTRYLRAAGTGVTANQELEWATGGGGATGGSTATQQDYVFQENAQVVRHNYRVGTTLAAQPGSGVTTGTCNALSAGPVTINNGVTVTIENGSNWVVI